MKTPLKKQRKYNYLFVIQQDCGQSWEDVSEYEATSTGKAIEKTTTKDGKTISLYKHDLKEYIFSQTGAVRGIFRKELNEDYTLQTPKIEEI